MMERDYPVCDREGARTRHESVFNNVHVQGRVRPVRAHLVPRLVAGVARRARALRLALLLLLALAQRLAQRAPSKEIARITAQLSQEIEIMGPLIN